MQQPCTPLTSSITTPSPPSPTTLIPSSPLYLTPFSPPPPFGPSPDPPSSLTHPPTNPSPPPPCPPPDYLVEESSPSSVQSWTSRLAHSSSPLVRHLGAALTREGIPTLRTFTTFGRRGPRSSYERISLREAYSRLPVSNGPHEGTLPSAFLYPRNGPITLGTPPPKPSTLYTPRQYSSEEIATLTLASQKEAAAAAATLARLFETAERQALYREHFPECYPLVQAPRNQCLPSHGRARYCRPTTFTPRVWDSPPSDTTPEEPTSPLAFIGWQRAGPHTTRRTPKSTYSTPASQLRAEEDLQSPPPTIAPLFPRAKLTPTPLESVPQDYSPFDAPSLTSLPLFTLRSSYPFPRSVKTAPWQPAPMLPHQNQAPPLPPHHLPPPSGPRPCNTQEAIDGLFAGLTIEDRPREHHRYWPTVPPASALPLHYFEVPTTSRFSPERPPSKREEQVRLDILNGSVDPTYGCCTVCLKTKPSSYRGKRWLTNHIPICPKRYLCKHCGEYVPIYSHICAFHPLVVPTPRIPDLRYYPISRSPCAQYNRFGTLIFDCQPHQNQALGVEDTPLTLFQKLDHYKALNTIHLVKCLVSAPTVQDRLSFITLLLELHSFFWTLDLSSELSTSIKDFLGDAFSYFQDLWTSNFPPASQPGPETHTPQGVEVVDSTKWESISAWISTTFGFNIDPQKFGFLLIPSGLLLSVATLVMGSRKALQEFDLSELLASASRIGKMFSGVKSFVEGITKVTHEIFNFLLTTVGLTYFKDEDREVQLIKERMITWKNHCTRLSRSINDDPASLLCTPQLFYNLRTDIDKIEHDLDNLVRQKKNVSNIKHVTDSLRADVKSLESLANRILACSVEKQVPVVLWIYGDSGIGKSQAIATIIDRLSQIEGRQLSVYTRSVGSKFWDNYLHQDVVVYDDYSASVESPEHLELVSLHTSARTMVPMAALEDKGMSFTSRYIFILSNFERVSTSSTLNRPDILDRRRDVLVRFEDPNLASYKAKHGVMPTKQSLKDDGSPYHDENYDHIVKTIVSPISPGRILERNVDLQHIVRKVHTLQVDRLKAFRIAVDKQLRSSASTVLKDLAAYHNDVTTTAHTPQAFSRPFSVTNRVAPLLLGPSGIGKTTIVKEVPNVSFIESPVEELPSGLVCLNDITTTSEYFTWAQSIVRRYYDGDFPQVKNLILTGNEDPYYDQLGLLSEEEQLRFTRRVSLYSFSWRSKKSWSLFTARYNHGDLASIPYMEAVLIEPEQGLPIAREALLHLLSNPPLEVLEKPIFLDLPTTSSFAPADILLSVDIPFAQFFSEIQHLDSTPRTLRYIQQHTKVVKGNTFAALNTLRGIFKSVDLSTASPDLAPLDFLVFINNMRLGYDGAPAIIKFTDVSLQALSICQRLCFVARSSSPSSDPDDDWFYDESGLSRLSGAFVEASEHMAEATTCLYQLVATEHVKKFQFLDFLQTLLDLGKLALAGNALHSIFRNTKFEHAFESIDSRVDRAEYWRPPVRHPVQDRANPRDLPNIANEYANWDRGLASWKPASGALWADMENESSMSFANWLETEQCSHLVNAALAADFGLPPHLAVASMIKRACTKLSYSLAFTLDPQTINNKFLTPHRLDLLRHALSTLAITPERKDMHIVEAVSDPEAYHLLHRVHQNQCHILNGDQAVFSGLIVMGRRGVTVCHGIHPTTTTFQVHTHRGDFTATVKKRDSYRDILLFELDSSAPEFKSIAHHLNSRKEPLPSNGRAAVLAIPDLHDLSYVDRLQVTAQDVCERDVTVMGTSQKVQGLIYRGCLTRLQYAAPIGTKVGDCGGVLIVTNPQTCRKIWGIHASATQFEGKASLIYEEDFLDHAAEAPLVETPLEPLPYQKLTLKTDFTIPEAQLPIVAIPLRPMGSPGKTSLFRSPLHVPLPECDTFEPTITHHRDNRLPDGYSGHIGYEALNKWNQPMPAVDETILKQVEEEVGSFFINLISQSSHPVRLLTTKEAINHPLEYPDMTPLARNTSSGYPWSLNPHTAKKGDFLHFDNNTWSLKTDNNGQALRRAMDQLEAACRKGTRTGVVFVGSLKDEIAKVKKVRIQPKTRMFAGAPICFTILHRRCFASIYAALKELRNKHPIAVGIDPLSTEWDSLYRQFLAVASTGFDADYEGWDARLHIAFVRAWFRILRRIHQVLNKEWTPELDALFKGVLLHLEGALVMFQGHVFQLPGGQVSGQPGTAPDNSAINFMYFLYAWIKLAPTEQRSLSCFLSRVCPKFFGDDVLCSVHPSAQDFFNFKTFSKVMLEINQVCQDARKAGEDYTILPLSRMTFLKRNFKYSNELCCYVGQLEKDSFQKMISWTKCNTTRRADDYRKILQYDLESIENTVDACLQEAFFWGIPTFTFFSNHCQTVLNKINSSKIVPSYFFFFNKFLGTSLYDELHPALLNIQNNIHIPQAMSDGPIDSTAQLPTTQNVSAIGAGESSTMEAIPHAGAFNNIDPWFKTQFVATDTISWAVNQQPGTILHYVPIHPHSANMYVKHLAKLYNVYVGGLDYNLKVCGTGFHAGSLGVARVPPNIEPQKLTTLEELTCFEYQVIDPKNLSIISKHVMDQRPVMYHYTNDYSVTKPDSFGGWFVIFVINSLNTSSSGTPQIQVQLFNKLSPDFEFLQITPTRISDGPAPVSGIPHTILSALASRGSTLSNWGRYAESLVALPRKAYPYLNRGLFGSYDFAGESNATSFTSLASHKSLPNDFFIMGNFKAIKGSPGTWRVTSDTWYPDVDFEEEQSAVLIDHTNTTPESTLAAIKSVTYLPKEDVFEIATNSIKTADIDKAMLIPAPFWRMKPNLLLEDGKQLKPELPESIMAYRPSTYERITNSSGIQITIAPQTTYLAMLLASGEYKDAIPSGMSAVLQIIDRNSDTAIGYARLHQKGYLTTHPVDEYLDYAISNIRFKFLHFIRTTEPLPLLTPEMRANRAIQKLEKLQKQLTASLSSTTLVSAGKGEAEHIPQSAAMIGGALGSSALKGVFTLGNTALQGQQHRQDLTLQAQLQRGLIQQQRGYQLDDRASHISALRDVGLPEYLSYSGGSAANLPRNVQHLGGRSYSASSLPGNPTTRFTPGSAAASLGWGQHVM